MDTKSIQESSFLNRLDIIYKIFTTPFSLILLLVSAVCMYMTSQTMEVLQKFFYVLPLCGYMVVLCLYVKHIHANNPFQKAFNELEKRMKFFFFFFASFFFCTVGLPIIFELCVPFLYSVFEVQTVHWLLFYGRQLVVPVASDCIWFLGLICVVFGSQLRAVFRSSWFVILLFLAVVVLLGTQMNLRGFSYYSEYAAHLDYSFPFLMIASMEIVEIYKTVVVLLLHLLMLDWVNHRLLANRS